MTDTPQNKTKQKQQASEALNASLADVDAGSETLSAKEKEALVDVEEETLQRWRRFLKHIHQHLENTEAPQQRAKLLYAKGELFEMQFGKHAIAQALYEDARQSYPKYLPALMALKRIFAMHEDYERVLALIDEISLCELTEREKRELTFEKSEILWKRLGKKNVAAETLEKLLEIDPENLSAFKLLESIYAESGDTGALNEFYYRILESPHLTSLQPIILQNLAASLESEEHTEPMAADVYQKIINFDPTNLVALSALKRLLTKLGRFEEILELLEREISATVDAKKRAQLKYRQARIYIDNLGEFEKALMILTEALELDNASEAILGELEYQREGREEWRELSGVLARRFEISESKEKKAEIAGRLGWLFFDKLHDNESAMLWFEKAIDNGSIDPATLELLERLFEETEKHEKLLVIYEHKLSNETNDSIKAQLLYKIAEVAHLQLQDHERAESAYRGLLAIRPGYLPAIKALSEIYTFLGRIDDLIEMNELLIDAKEELGREQAIYTLEKTLSLYENKNDTEKAIEAAKKILTLDEKNLAATRTLGRLYAKSGRYKALIEMNDKEASLIEDAQRIVMLKAKNGEIAANKLDDKEQALAYHQEALEINPSYQPSFKAISKLYKAERKWDDLIGLYEKQLASETLTEAETLEAHLRIARISANEIGEAEQVIEQCEACLAVDPAFTPALNLLIATYETKEDNKALANLYERIIEQDSDWAHEQGYLHKAAEFHESVMQDIEKARSLHDAILEKNPADETAGQAILRIALKENDIPRQIALLKAKIEAEPDEEQKKPMILMLADIYANETGMEKKALSLYEEIFASEPLNLVVFGQIDRLYRKIGETKPLIDLYEKRLEAQTLERDKLTTLWLLVDIVQSETESAKDLLPYYERIMALDAEHPRILAFFERYGIETDNHETLLAAYQRLRELTEDEGRLLHLYNASGHILEFKEEKHEEASFLYESAMALDPNDFVAMQGAKRVYSKLEMWGQLAELLERELAETNKKPVYIATAYQLAFLKETKFSQRSEARDLYFKIIERKPNHNEAFHRLDGILREDNDLGRLAALYEYRLKSIKDEKEIRTLHEQIAEIAERKLGDFNLAATHRKALLAQNPNDEAAKEHLGMLFSRMKRWLDAIELLEALDNESKDDSRLYRVRMEMGRIYHDELKSEKKALTAFEKLEKTHGEDKHVLKRLARLYRSVGDAAKAKDALELLLIEPENIQEEIEYNLALGELYLESFADEHKAADHFDKALSLDPNNVHSFELMTKLFEKKGKWDRLTEVYRRNIEATDEKEIEKRRVLILQLARVYLDRMNDPEEAMKTIETLPEAERENIEIRAMQARALAQIPAQYDDAVEAHRALLEENPFRIESYRELHRIFSAQERNDEAFCALLPLEFLSELSAEEALGLQRNRDSLTGGIPTKLPEEAIEKWLYHPKEEGVVVEILKIIEPIIRRFTPVPNDQYDLGNCSRINAQNSIYYLFENAVYRLGLDKVEMYLSEQQPDVFAVLHGKPPGVVVGSNLAFASEPIKRFLAGMSMSKLKLGHVVLTDYDYSRLRYWTELAVNLYIPEVQVEGESPKIIETQRKEMNKLIPSNRRKELEEAAHAFHKLTKYPNFENIHRAMRHSDNRMGLLFNWDLSAAAECLVYLETGEPIRLATNAGDVIEAFSNHEAIKELLKFAVSEAHFELRRAMKVDLR